MSAIEVQEVAPVTPIRRGRRKAFSLFFVVLVMPSAASLIYWLHAQQFESTDDAQVDGT